MAEEYELVHPSDVYADQIRSYRQIFLKKHQSLDGTSELKNHEDPYEWIRYVKLFEKADTVPAGMVQSDQYLYVRKEDNAVVGMIQVRHALNESLSLIGGHIGYSVIPKERRKGIATEMVGNVLPLCKKLGLKQVLLTCRKDNIGSRNVIVANGGVYEGDIADDHDIHERYWIDL